MNPDLLAHLCKLIGYLEGSTIQDEGLKECVEPIEAIVNTEIAALSVPVPVPLTTLHCTHEWHDPRQDVNCLPECPECGQTHAPVPKVVSELPFGIVSNPDGTASGTNTLTEEKEIYFHCPDICDGWREGKRVEHKIYDDKRLGVAYYCPICNTELQFVGKIL